MADKFVSTSRLPELTQQLAGGSPMSPIYLAPEDSVRISLINFNATATYMFSGRLLRPDGITIPLLQELQVARDGTSVNTWIPMAEGYLLSAMVGTLSGTPLRTECYAMMALVRGSPPWAPAFAVLGTGYVSRYQLLLWPWAARSDELTSEPGLRERINPSVPAGSSVTVTVPANRSWLVKAITFRLVTEAAVATRTVSVYVIDSGLLVVGQNVIGNQAANETHFVSMGIGIQSADAPSPQDHFRPLFQEVMLLPGWQLQIGVGNIQPGDELQYISITVESFQYWQ